MPFLRKITGSAHSHSRSGSASSAKTWSLDSPTSAERHTLRPTKSSKKSVSSEYRNSVASSGSFGNSNNGGQDILVVPDIDEFRSPQLSAINNDSRKSSGGSVNSLSFDKLILSWDPTDPDEWTMQRVSSWLKFHEFPESWITFFKKHQLSGHKFIKFLAYDNFAVYEKYLPQSKYASYTRFQYLLKQTMSKSVTNNHIRQKSTEKAKESRSSSESLKSKHKKAHSLQESSSSRSASESALSTAKPNSSTSDEKLGGQPVRTHQKASSASALYRRSLISLRGASTGNLLEGKTASSIKLNIPSRPQSIVESNGSSTKSISPPNSPYYPGIFRRHQKSSSSESSLLNTLFGSQSNGNIEDEHEKLMLPSTNTPADNAPKRNAHEGNAGSSAVSSPYPVEEKSSLWGKFKRRSHLASPANVPSSSQLVSPNTVQSSLSSSLSTPNIDVLPVSASDGSIGTLTPKNTDIKTAQATPSSSRNQTSSKVKKENTSSTIDGYTPSSFLLDKKFYPLKTKDSQDDTYILITKDNKSFIPMNIGMIDSLEGLKESITLMLNINHSDITVHLTDFGCEIGSALPDNILESLRFSLFLNTAGKLYIKDQSKTNARHRAATFSHEMNHSVKSMKSRNSFRSITNSMMNSTDEVSIVTSSSDLTSFDDHTSGTGRRYPQTPSNYCDTVNTNNGEETNYWNFKELSGETNKSPKPLRSSSQIKKDKSLPFELAPEKGRMGTFHILRKEDPNEIDFNKRRESPYVQPELAPRREAPKPPTNSSPQKSLSISSRVSTPRVRRSSTKRRATNNSKLSLPSPSGEATSPSSDSVVNSYTPGSSHVLVPQPYKGASDGSRKFKSEEEQPTNSISNFINKQRSNRSDSVASTSGSVLHMRSPPLNRGNSRRIVSSASAADVFDENDITFADAPEFTDSGGDTSSSDDIIWSGPTSMRNDKEQSQEVLAPSEMNSIGSDYFESDERLGVNRKMTLRPSPEVVYQNLEKFFPHANLDKPVLEGVTPPASPKAVENMAMSKAFDNSTSCHDSDDNVLGKNVPKLSRVDEKGYLRDTRLKRAKTIRTIAHEASEARKQSMKVRRQNTKMWGTKTVEVTDKRMVSINNSKNSRGQYKEFAWIKGEMIGKGSFGAVYLCLNVTTGEMMAVKQVEVPRYGSQNEQIIHTVEALRAEMSTLKNLDHLNIVQYLGFEAKDNMNSLFLEYVAGGSVGSLIRMYGRFDEAMIQHLTTQVLRGLSYLHSRGILHRDMKADNLLLDQEGVCKISDFGISRKSKDIYSNSEMTMRGTVFWMAPEMVDTAQGYSAKVDIWSMGCVVLEMFAGKRPWSNLEVVAAMFKIGKSKSAPPIPEDTLPLISQSGREFIDACFQINPESRPTADKLLSHSFIVNREKFDFKSTKLAELIKSNDKVNSTRLRVNSQENNQLNH